MEFIRGCSIVNCGLVRFYKLGGREHINSPLYACEVLSPLVNGFKDKMICNYDIIEGIKTEFVYLLIDNVATIIVYKFKNPTENHHYWSRQYTINNLPSKYNKYLEELIWAYKMEFLERNYC